MLPSLVITPAPDGPVPRITNRYGERPHERKQRIAVQRSYRVGGRYELKEYCRLRGVPYSTVHSIVATWPLGSYYQAFHATLAYVKLKHTPGAAPYLVRRAQIVARRWSKLVRGPDHGNAEAGSEATSVVEAPAPLLEA
jgi:hypothetical protein